MPASCGTCLCIEPMSLPLDAQGAEKVAQGQRGVCAVTHIALSPHSWRGIAARNSMSLIEKLKLRVAPGPEVVPLSIDC